MSSRGVSLFSWQQDSSFKDNRPRPVKLAPEDLNPVNSDYNTEQFFSRGKVKKKKQERIWLHDLYGESAHRITAKCPKQKVSTKEELFYVISRES